VLIDLPDADTLAVVFERADALLEAARVRPAVDLTIALTVGAEQSAETKQIPETEQITEAEKVPATTTTSSPNARWNVRKRMLLLTGGAFAIMVCWLLAIKNPLKGYLKTGESPSCA
jgi:hypothetical protein